jgi:hypothetical protein
MVQALKEIIPSSGPETLPVEVTVTGSANVGLVRLMPTVVVPEIVDMVMDASDCGREDRVAISRGGFQA